MQNFRPRAAAELLAYQYLHNCVLDALSAESGQQQSYVDASEELPRAQDEQDPQREAENETA
eukprot:3021278-Lingulodinium_polyedra.AAC.1